MPMMDGLPTFSRVSFFWAMCLSFDMFFSSWLCASLSRCEISLVVNMFFGCG